MRLFSMYGWVRWRHRLEVSGRGFFHAPWAGGAVLLARGDRHAAGQHPGYVGLLQASARNRSGPESQQSRWGDRLAVPARDDRREVRQRRTDGSLFRRGARNQTRDRLRTALLGAQGDSAGAGRCGRHAGAGGDLPRVQRRDGGRERLGNPHGDGHRIRDRHSLDARRPRARVAQGLSHGAGHCGRSGCDSGDRPLLRR